MNELKKKKTRNYAIDFYRFLFAMGFIVGHIAIVGFRSFAPRESASTFAFDTMIIFIALSGFFMMQHFKKCQAKAAGQNIHPVTQAWGYLKGRIRGMGPWFLFANLLGFVALRVWKQTPVTQWSTCSAGWDWAA